MSNVPLDSGINPKRRGPFSPFLVLSIVHEPCLCTAGRRTLERTFGRGWGVCAELPYGVYPREGVRRHVPIDCGLYAQITPGYAESRLRDCLLDG